MQTRIVRFPCKYVKSFMSQNQNTTNVYLKSKIKVIAQRKYVGLSAVKRYRSTDTLTDFKLNGW